MHHEHQESLDHNTTLSHFMITKDLSLLTSSSCASNTASANNLSGSSSLSLSEKTLNAKTDLNRLTREHEPLKVEDYLNELEHLSNQNSFALSKSFALDNGHDEVNETILNTHEVHSPRKFNYLNVNTNAPVNGCSEEATVAMHTNNSETSSGYLSFSAMNVNVHGCLAQSKRTSRRSLSPSVNEKRVSYILATASSKNLNTDLTDN